MALTLMYITNDPVVAAFAEESGVVRIWIDLETLGKEERQKGLDTVKSCHSIADIARIAPKLTKAEMLVRVNPINENSENEINSVIAAGADIIMLPMWKTPEEVKRFIELVNGRVKTTLLLETKEAVECVDEVLAAGGFDEIHIGLNDLHLSYGLTFMFELLVNGVVEELCSKFRQYNIPFGFGGVAKLGKGLVSSEMIIKEHFRLGSTRAILSRSFYDSKLICDEAETRKFFSENMRELRDYEKVVARCSTKELLENEAEVKKRVEAIVKKIKGGVDKA